MAVPYWVRQMLLIREVPYEECHHGTAYTAQRVAEKEHISGHRVAKVVVVIADGRFVELVLPATRRVVLDKVGDILGVRTVRLATEEEMENVFPDVEAGAIPPLDHWPDIEVLMD